MTQESQLNEVLSLYHAVEKDLVRTANLAKALEMTVLTLSVITSGSLWLLLSERIPQSMLWLGAVASTLTVGITLYLGTTGLNRKRTQILDLHGRLGELLAEVRTHAIDEKLFWSIYKQLEHQLRVIQHGTSHA
jgi:hypothetical protein